MRKGINRLIKVIAGVGVLTSVYSCESCNADEMPLLVVYFPNQEVQTYTVSGELIDRKTFQTNERLLLPFSLKSDTVMYEFEGDAGAVGRLELAYVRTAKFEGTACGFFLNIQEVHALPQTTFTEVQISGTDYNSGWEIYLYE